MIKVKIYWDDEAKVWIAINMEIGLTIESDSYDILVEKVQLAAPEMALENKVEYTRIVIEKVEGKIDVTAENLENNGIVKGKVMGKYLALAQMIDSNVITPEYAAKEMRMSVSDFYRKIESIYLYLEEESKETDIKTMRDVAKYLEKNGLETGLNNGKVLTYAKLVKEQIITPEYAANELNMSISEFEKELGEKNNDN